MKLLPAAALLLAFLSGCGGPDVGTEDSPLGTPHRLTTDRLAGSRLVTFSRVTNQTQACTPDAAPTAVSNTMNLWPPNHSLHLITAADCVTVTDDCDSDLGAELVWASSDEPTNDIGDGNTDADIIFGCAGVELRSERQGPQNGRVYHIGWRVEDSGGNVVEGDCSIIVDHDQRGVVGEDDGEAYRVEFDNSTCGGDVETPPVDECPDPTNANCL